MLSTTAVTSRSQYVPVARLARGGMAEIVLARLGGASGFEKLVVLKRLLPHLAGQKRHVSMFLHEACVAARISHPNVCQVYELGEAGGHYNIVMEYLEGAAVGQVVLGLPARRGEHEVRLLVEVFRQLCAGLHHAHEARTAGGEPAGLVHRDVSPQNLLVTVDGVAKVLDFGIAKSSWSRTETRAGVILGKVGYLSPEQVRRERLDRRSDVFSLGVVLHEALTGLSLFHRDTSIETCKAVLACVVPAVRETQPQVPAALDAVVRQALSPRREDRPASAAELAALLVAAIAPLGGPLHTSEVAGWMVARFGDAIEARRRRVAMALSEQARGAADPGSTQVELATLPVVAHDLADDRAAPGAGEGGVPRTAPVPHGLHPGRVLFAPAGLGWARAAAQAARLGSQGAGLPGPGLPGAGSQGPTTEDVSGVPLVPGAPAAPSELVPLAAPETPAPLLAAVAALTPGYATVTGLEGEPAGPDVETTTERLGTPRALTSRPGPLPLPAPATHETFLAGIGTLSPTDVTGAGLGGLGPEHDADAATLPAAAASTSLPTGPAPVLRLHRRVATLVAGLTTSLVAGQSRRRVVAVAAGVTLAAAMAAMLLARARPPEDAPPAPAALAAPAAPAPTRVAAPLDGLTLAGFAAPRPPAPAPGPVAAAEAAPVPSAPTAPSPRARPSTRPGTGYLTLDSHPYGVVFVDGKRAGITPLVRQPVAAGVHRIVVQLGDGREQRLRMTIEAGKEAPRRRVDW